MVESLVEATDRLYKLYGPSSSKVYGPSKGRLKPNGNLLLLDVLGKDDRFLDLVDWTHTFPKIVDILGWNIQLYHSHLGVNPGLNQDPPSQLPAERLSWHQDTGQLNHDLETSPRPRISLKVGFFLTSTNEPNRGCFHVIPGRHLEDTLDLPDDETVEHPEALPVMVEAGDAVFFDRRVCYSYRWLKPRDDMTVGHYIDRADPIRRQLLGVSVNGGYGFTSPSDEDVPLKRWWQDHAADS